MQTNCPCSRDDKNKIKIEPFLNSQSNAILAQINSFACGERPKIELFTLWPQLALSLVSASWGSFCIPYLEPGYEVAESSSVLWLIASGPSPHPDGLEMLRCIWLCGFHLGLLSSKVVCCGRSTRAFVYFPLVKPHPPVFFFFANNAGRKPEKYSYFSCLEKLSPAHNTFQVSPNKQKQNKTKKRIIINN